MQTSTPLPQNQGPRQRVNFVAPQLTPLKKDRTNIEPALLNESNDDIERAERRRSVAIRRSVLALPTSNNSPSLNDSMRMLSDEDLKSQLQTFCKLNAENRISSKNAWNLRIIDVLKQIVTKNNPDVLKVAGNSLEIAGKVYGLRVDDLHSESLKLASSLARNFASKGNQNEENDENQDPNASHQENQRKKKQPKKKRLLLSEDKKHTVSDDPKAFLGTLPKLESAAFSARTDTSLSVIGNLFTNKVRMDPAGYKFMFASKEKAFAWTVGNDPLIKPETDKKFPITIKSVKSFKLCAPFKDFRVDLWDPDQENAELLRKSSALEDVVLDNDGIPIAELDGSVHDVFEERDDEDVNDDCVEEVVAPLVRQDAEHIVDFRPGTQNLGISVEKSAYSFNNIVETHSGKIDQIWAGPGHWKLKFIRRNRMVYSGRDRGDDKNKKRAAKKKVEAVYVDLLKCAPPKDFTKNIVKKVFKKKNLLVDAQKLTIPLLESSCVKLLQNIEYLMTIPTMKPVKKSQTETEYCVSDYKYDNPNDSNYCPQEMVGDDNGADLGDDIFDNGEIDRGSQESEAFMGNNLVDAPQMVQQIDLSYATRAKKVDMKKLKQAVWCTLTQKEEYDLSTKVTPLPFSELYRDVPKLLTEKMRAEISCPIVFVALLHLCNEQNLKLERHADITDFGIVGPGN